MKKRNVILIFLFCVTLFFISFIYGYKMMSPKLDKEPLIISDNHLDLEILKEEERISPNVYIEKKTYYEACNHNITKLNEIDNQIVNMTEKQYREYMKKNFPNVKIISFSINRIVLREEITMSNVVMGSNGKDLIFRLMKMEVLIKYPRDPILLKEIDQNKPIRDEVNSEEELSLC